MRPSSYCSSLLRRHLTRASQRRRLGILVFTTCPYFDYFISQLAIGQFYFAQEVITPKAILLPDGPSKKRQVWVRTRLTGTGANSHEAAPLVGTNWCKLVRTVAHQCTSPFIGTVPLERCNWTGAVGQSCGPRILRLSTLRLAKYRLGYSMDR